MYLPVCKAGGSRAGVRIHGPWYMHRVGGHIGMALRLPAMVLHVRMRIRHTRTRPRIRTRIT